MLWATVLDAMWLRNPVLTSLVWLVLLRDSHVPVRGTNWSLSKFNMSSTGLLPKSSKNLRTNLKSEKNSERCVRTVSLSPQ